VRSVGDHRAEQRDPQDGGPVAHGVITLGSQLQPEDDEESADPDQGGQRDADGTEEVRAGFSHPGGQQLDDPEEEEDLRNLGGTECSGGHGTRR
jgi:hypothetical protein